MSLNNTPSANRLHIGIFGKVNSGKSSLINAITNQETALVSPVRGTTTDYVVKAMEVRGIGACAFIDTAGFDDNGELGSLRMDKTAEALDKSDIAIMVFADGEIETEKRWIEKIKEKNVPLLAVINKADEIDSEALSRKLKDELSLEAVKVSAKDKTGIDEILAMLTRLVPEDFDQKSITGDLVKAGDVVLLLMPQDSEAPKGRLILPQVQTTRDLLDNGCVIVSATEKTYIEAINSLKEPPKLIITDSKVFKFAYENKPKESKLTSFSVLFAAYKGDLNEYIKGARAIDSLNENSRVLIAEACTHAPLSEDIGRVRIPNMLRKRFGEEIKVDIVSGTNFPSDLSGYDLIIHCGGCMFNRKYLQNRIAKAKSQFVPITNYGVLLAYLNGIIDKITL